MRQMSSIQPATCGNSSLTSVPHCPLGTSIHEDELVAGEQDPGKTGPRRTGTRFLGKVARGQPPAHSLKIRGAFSGFFRRRAAPQSQEVTGLNAPGIVRAGSDHPIPEDRETEGLREGETREPEGFLP